ncbi:MAG: sulfite exporter TauE/SafE family protein [Bdellovibrionota bacterium]
MSLLLFFILGLSVGILGTLMGIGGGIILIPVLLALYPELPPQHITAISLFCVAINSTVGSISYLIKKKVHLRSAALFSLASLPGAWLGVQLNGMLNRNTYETSFGAFLFIMGVYLFIKKPKPSSTVNTHQLNPNRKTYILGTIGSFFVGIFASVLGLGGGIIHVPFLIEVVQFPAHVAVATSHTILAVSTIVASAEHYINQTLTFHQPVVFYIAAGIALGAPFGAKLSSRVKGTTIVRLLSVALILAALRLVFF